MLQVPELAAALAQPYFAQEARALRSLAPLGLANPCAERVLASRGMSAGAVWQGDCRLAHGARLREVRLRGVLRAQPLASGATAQASSSPTPLYL